MNGLMEELIGVKMMDFGERYTLYKINPKFDSEYIFVNRDDKNIDIDYNSNITYKKLSSGLFEVSLDNPSDNSYLIFLEPYNPYWMLLDENKREITGNHTVAFNYANAWDIGSFNTGSHTFYIYFYPYKYHHFAVAVSVVSFSFVIIYLFYSLKHKRKKVK
jgi:hypothetical protein